MNLSIFSPLISFPFPKPSNLSIFSPLISWVIAAAMPILETTNTNQFVIINNKGWSEEVDEGDGVDQLIIRIQLKEKHQVFHASSNSRRAWILKNELIPIQETQLLVPQIKTSTLRSSLLTHLQTIHNLPRNCRLQVLESISLYADECCVHRQANSDWGVPSNLIIASEVILVTRRMIFVHRLHSIQPAIRESMDSTQQEGRFGWVPAATNSMQNLLQSKKFESHDGSSSAANCSICKEDLFFNNNNNLEQEEEVEVVEMPCSHVFHKPCIVHWLQINHTCPLCRFQMPTASSQQS